MMLKNAGLGFFVVLLMVSGAYLFTNYQASKNAKNEGAYYPGGFLQEEQAIDQAEIFQDNRLGTQSPILKKEKSTEPTKETLLTTPPAKQQLPQIEVEKTETSDKSKLFTDLMKEFTNPQKCLMRIAVDDVMATAEIYVFEKDYKAEVIYLTQGKRIDSNFMIKGKHGYTWSSIAPFGTYMNIDILTKEFANQDIQISEKDAFGLLDSIQEYTCEDWVNVDMSKFNVPTHIQFMDITSSMLAQ